MKKRLLCLLLMCLMILSLFPTAGAVNESDIKGDGNTSVTFYVTTGKKWKSSDYIKLEGTKGILRAGTWSVNGPTEDEMPQSDEMFGYYHVEVWKKSGDDWKYESKLSEDCWNDASHTIKKLKKNTEYKINVSSYSMSEICNMHWIKYSEAFGVPLFNFLSRINGENAKCVYIKWGDNHVPEWHISKTKGTCTYSL